ncbi:sigma-54-dependent Fis family transcriptional regulator [bacterium]|nr:sigma-54-dependent Fis family transcriptional regulator [candidate division CSSED10-310 bacterium]
MPGEKILIIDDEARVVEAIRAVLEDDGYVVMSASSGESALENLDRDLPDLVLLDIWLKGIDGLETLARIRETAPDLGVIMISGHGTIESAIKATRLGALNFIEKPLSLDKLLLEVRQAIKQTALERENRDLRKQVSQRHRIIGQGRSMQSILKRIEVAAPSNARVLISGESGTGKELVAREIHRSSNRSTRSFIEVNCAAIPEDLIESELFGHEKGAFTHAINRKRGKFELAHGGTLFLDEVGDMSLKTQAKVLRVLEEGRIERVGGHQCIPVDVRVIAASNKNLQHEIRENRFREDLFYRLNVIPIDLPPLRERSDDIPDLIRYFLDFFCSEYGKPLKTISTDAMKNLESYSWPGNIRELRNEVERLVIMTGSVEIGTDDLRPELSGMSGHSLSGLPSSGLNLRDARDQFERQYILQNLVKTGWNVTQCADILGIERSNLHRKMKQLGIPSSGDSRTNQIGGRARHVKRGSE